jgi:hypothetical protein
MASGFFGVTGPRHFELGAEARPHERVERLVLDRHAARPPHLLAQRLGRGEAFGAAQRLLQAGEHRGRQRAGLARGDVGRQQGGQPSHGVAGQPMADGVALQARHVLARAGVPAGQQVQHLQTGLLVAVMFMVQALFERGDRFGDRRDGVAHRAPSRQEASSLS